MSNGVDFSKLEVSNDELLRGITSSALAAMQYVSKLDAAEDQKEIAQYSSSVIKGLQGLSQGWDDDLYKSVLESLEDVKTASTNSDYDKTYQSGLRDLHELGTLSLSRLKVVEDAMVAGETKLTELNKDMSLLKRRTPDSLDIIKAVGTNEAGKIEALATTSAKQIGNRITNITDNIDYINQLNKIDVDKDIEGLQIDLSQASAEYYQRVAEKAGFGRDIAQKDMIEGTVDYYLPDDMQLNVSTYKDALAWLNKWEAYQSDKQVKSVETQIKHEETRVFDFVNQLGFSADPLELAGFQALTTGLYGTDKDKKMANAILDELQIADPDIANNVRKWGNELDQLFATGKYKSDFDALDKFAMESGVSMRENILENLSEEQKMQRESDANIIISDIDILNEAITNANSMSDKDVLDLPNVASNSENLDKIPARVEAFKRQHVDILSKLIDQDTFMFGEGSADDHPLQLLKNATSLSDKYRHLQTLATTYIGPDGTQLLPNKVSAMWDSDKEQIDIFYKLLQSFNSLLVLNPLPSFGKEDIGK